MVLCVEEEGAHGGGVCSWRRRRVLLEKGVLMGEEGAPGGGRKSRFPLVTSLNSAVLGSQLAGEDFAYSSSLAT